MEKISVWEDLNKKTLEDVDTAFNSIEDNQQSQKNAGTYNGFKVNKTVKNFQMTIAKTTWMIDRYDFEYLYSSNKDQSESENKCYVIVMSDNTKVRYFINKQGNGAQVALQLFNSNLNKQLQIQQLALNNNDPDLLLWLVYKHYSSNGVSLTNGDNTTVMDGDNQLEIKSITAIKGETADEITNVAAEGDSLTNYMSVLTFLMESSEVHKLGLRVSYGNHKIVEFAYDTPRKNAVISVEPLTYVGPLRDTSEYKQAAAVIILVHMEIIPKLTQLYNEDNWQIQDKKDFFQSLGKEIREKVETLISGLDEKFTVQTELGLSDN